MAQSLFDCLDALHPRIECAARLLLFLDFDGTLAPIVDFPNDAQLPESTRAVLRAMTESPAFLVSLISGRSIVDLHRRAGLNAAVYGGNHGLEIHGADIEFEEPDAAAKRPALRALVGALRAKLFVLDGVEIENKKLSASVHFRRAPEAREKVFSALQELVDQSLFRVREGKMVAEILPRTGANKGTAVRHIRSLREVEGDLAICAGDDTTDEDLFTAAGDGLTIRVGNTADTAAEYFVDDTARMRDFLIWLAEIKDREHGW